MFKLCFTRTEMSCREVQGLNQQDQVAHRGGREAVTELWRDPCMNLSPRLPFHFCFIALGRGCQLDVGKQRRSAEKHRYGAISSWQRLPAFPDDSSQLFLCSAYCRMPSQRLGILIPSSARWVELLSGLRAEWGAAGTGGTGTVCGIHASPRLKAQTPLCVSSSHQEQKHKALRCAGAGRAAPLPEEAGKEPCSLPRKHGQGKQSGAFSTGR